MAAEKQIVEGESLEQAPGCPFARWRDDFPIQWDNDHYVSRREMTKFLTLGSALLAVSNGALALVGLGSPGAHRSYPEKRIAASAEIAPEQSLLFRFPNDDDPCILLRDADGELQAFSQICTHLSCAVVHRPEEQVLYCPCHHGYFSESRGEPLAGPPTRRLPRILLTERNGEIFAVGVEV
jgi:Rieske Fe-S protein